jgi:hypothetical protein
MTDFYYTVEYQTAKTYRGKVERYEWKRSSSGYETQEEALNDYLNDPDYNPGTSFRIVKQYYEVVEYFGAEPKETA